MFVYMYLVESVVCEWEQKNISFYLFILPLAWLWVREKLNQLKEKENNRNRGVKKYI